MSRFYITQLFQAAYYCVGLIIRISSTTQPWLFSINIHPFANTTIIINGEATTQQQQHNSVPQLCA